MRMPEFLSHFLQDISHNLFNYTKLYIACSSLLSTPRKYDKTIPFVDVLKALKTYKAIFEWTIEGPLQTSI